MLLLQGAKNKLAQLAFSREGNLLAVPVWKKGVQIWHPHYDAESVTTIPDKDGATHAVFTSSGQVFIQGNHTFFLLHDSTTPTTSITPLSDLDGLPISVKISGWTHESWPSCGRI